MPLTKWSRAQRAKFMKTMREKKRAAKREAKGGVLIPIHAIPPRNEIVVAQPRAPKQVFAEYDLSKDVMYLVMGKTRMPLRVK